MPPSDVVGKTNDEVCILVRDRALGRIHGTKDAHAHEHHAIEVERERERHHAEELSSQHEVRGIGSEYERWCQRWYQRWYPLPPLFPT